MLELELGKVRPTQVINCGFACGTYNPAGYDDWMQSDGLLLAPDLVIVGFCLNDMEGKNNDVPMLAYRVRKPEPHWSALVEYAMATYEWRRARTEVTDFAARVRERPAVWNATQDGLRNLAAICKQADIPLVVAVFPMLSQLDLEPYPYAELIAMVEAFCATEQIPCVDVSPAFVGHADEMDLWVHVTDQHPNDVGHRMMANSILTFLRERRLAPQ